ncbi:hypothetical protein HDU81_001917 [Chytriomyces hyalinus]|nr:hypothetical protein HDU81_001917 [Chytriomyces hyalinus]
MDSIAAEVEYWRQMRIKNGETPTPSLQRKTRSAADLASVLDMYRTESRRKFEYASAEYTLERRQQETPAASPEIQARQLYTAQFVDSFSGVVNITSSVGDPAVEDDPGERATIRDRTSTSSNTPRFIRSAPSDPGFGLREQQQRMDLNHLYHCHYPPQSTNTNPALVSVTHLHRIEAERRRTVRKSASCSLLQTTPPRLLLLARDTPSALATHKKVSLWARAKGTWNKLFVPLKLSTQVTSPTDQSPYSLRSRRSRSSLVTSTPTPKGFFGSMLRRERVDSSEYNSMMAQPVPEGENRW